MAMRHGDHIVSVASIKRRLNTVVPVCLVFAFCYLAGKLGGILIITSPQTLWPLWPGCAALVAILLISPRKIWPFLIAAGLAGFVLYDFQTGVPLLSIAWLILADLSEIFVATWGVSYLLRGSHRLNSLKALGKYVFVAVILASFAAASIGIQALNGDRWISFRINFLSEGLSFLTVAPAILGWSEQRKTWTRAIYAEAAMLFAAIAALSYVIFVAPSTYESPALLYSLVPFLLWSALRLGTTGAATTSTIIALVSIWGAIHGRGPFTETDPINRIFTLQLFLLFTAMPTMVLAILVEERKQQEAVLRESEERFRLMADTAPSLIWMSTTNKQCTFFNRGWLNFTGHTMEQELGDGWTTGIHQDDRERCMAIYSAAFDARQDFEMEYRLRRYDGEYRWLVDYGVPRFGSNGAFCGYIGSCVDITERKLSEISLRELTGRLLHAQEEERSRIARELHDDISQRTSLLQIRLEQFEQNTSTLTLSDRNQLQNLTELASEISSDLHNICYQLHPGKLDLQGLIPTMASFCREFSDQHDLRVTFRHHDELGEIPKDVTLCLFRIAQEALRNVLKHARTSEAQVELFVRGDGIELCVSDSGAGFRLESIQGAGLGLISMRERLRLIGGHLAVESEPSRGTRIRVRVPLSRSEMGDASELKHYKVNA